MNLKELLKNKLTEEELTKAVRAYDVIGDIVIIEVPDELKKREKLVAETLLENHKNIKAVFKKGKHTGKYRLQKPEWLAGERKRETEYRENNVRIKLNVETSYFSPRLSTERKRIMEQVKKGETVLVMFSGVGPYPLVIAKNTKAKEIFSVEINPKAVKYQNENILLNKIKNIRLHRGDVKKIIPKLNKKFDRVLMPLPKGAEDYLDTAIKAVKKKGIIHFYDFLNEEEIPNTSVNKIKKECNKLNKKFEILKTTKCGQLAARQYRVCVDFRVL